MFAAFLLTLSMQLDATRLVDALEGQLRISDLNARSLPNKVKAIAKGLGQNLYTVEPLRRLSPHAPTVLFVLDNAMNDRIFSILLENRQGRVAGQVIDRGGMGSQGWVIESGEVSRNGDLLTVVGSAYFGGNWIVPALRSYRLSSGQWREVQRIDSEYESAIRNPAFLRGHTGIDDRVVVVYTRRYPSNLSQPHVGPLLNFAERWCRRGDQYVVEPAHEIPSPLGTLNVLVGAVKSGDHRLFDAYAPRRLRYRLWRIIEDEPGEVDVTTVSNVVYDDAKTLVLRDSGIRVRFRKVGRAFLPVRVD